MNKYVVRLFKGENDGEVLRISETESYYCAGTWRYHYLCEKESDSRNANYGYDLRLWLKELDEDTELLVQVFNMQDSAMLAEILEGLTNVGKSNTVRAEFFENGECVAGRYYKMKPVELPTYHTFKVTDIYWGECEYPECFPEEIIVPITEKCEDYYDVKQYLHDNYYWDVQYFDCEELD